MANHTTRKHAAIMFTDIVGYTALMGSNEDQAFEVLKKNREIHSKFINNYQGTLIKEMGDGMLISFDLASDAVRCAIEIQKECKNQHIPLKIGIHEGEMVFEGNDVLGDGVNIASRIQDGAEEGLIFISGAVFREIKNKTDIKTKYEAEKHFKNVDEKIKIYRVNSLEDGKSQNENGQFSGLSNSRNHGKIRIVGLISATIIIIMISLIWLVSGTDNAIKESYIIDTEKAKSIAVLPFIDLSNNQNNSLLGEGFTYELILNLSKIKSFDKVVPYISVIKYKGSDEQVTALGKELRVSYILHGTLIQSGNRIRVNVTLADAEFNNMIWSDQFDNNFEDIFSLQSEIPLQIAKELQSFVSENERKSIEKTPTQNMEAYQWYQRAAVLHMAISQENISRDSIKQYLNRAISIDPDFAHAYGLLGLYTILDGTTWGKKSMSNAAWEAKAFCDRALEIDPNEYWALLTKALIFGWAEWNYIDAEKYFLKSIEEMPNNVSHISWYGFFLFLMDRNNEALEYLEVLEEKGSAYEISNKLQTTHFRALLKLAEFDKASHVNQKYLSMGDSSYFSEAAFYYLCTSNYDSALYYFKISEGINHWRVKQSDVQCQLTICYYKNSQPEKAFEIINHLKTESKHTSGIYEFWVASYYSAIGSVDSAFYWLDKAYLARSPEISQLRSFELLQPIREDSRYWDLYKKTGHAAYDEYLENHIATAH